MLDFIVNFLVSWTYLDPDFDEFDRDLDLAADEVSPGE